MWQVLHSNIQQKLCCGFFSDPEAKLPTTRIPEELKRHMISFLINDSLKQKNYFKKSTNTNFIPAVNKTKNKQVRMILLLNLMVPRYEPSTPPMATAMIQ